MRLHPTLCALPLLALLAACEAPPSESPQVGSQTNWLVACDTSDTCGELECLCGTCTLACVSDMACAELPGAECVAPSDDDASALCAGQASQASMCLPRCDGPCPEGTRCVAGVCEPPAGTRVRVTIDPDVGHQTLMGFGAALVYTDDAIAGHPNPAALYDAMFAESGLDVLRIRNRYEDGREAALGSTVAIVAGARERLGRTPTLFMTSSSPPAALKENGSRLCAGDPEVCTLSTRPDGGFDYEGFADHWRASLEAYARAGIAPDYVSIQNNPNWVPPADSGIEACRFLPAEGTTTVVVDGAPREVTYPGYREALASVRAAIADLPARPRIGAPEVTSPSAVGDYAPSLASDSFDALALHLYSPGGVDMEGLSAVRQYAAQVQRPVWQTEMQADGLETATLVHHAMTVGNAAAYLQNDFVALSPGNSEVALLRLMGDRVERQGPFYALSHYAKHTDPGFRRVDAESEAADGGGSASVLSSAWLAPDAEALTIVLVNPGAADRFAEIVLPVSLRDRLVPTALLRTVFEGDERAAPLSPPAGPLAVSVPAGSVVTIALTAE